MANEWNVVSEEPQEAQPVQGKQTSSWDVVNEQRTDYSPVPLMERPYSDKIALYANKYNIDPGLAHNVVNAESTYDPRAVSDKGAMGLTQLMPGTARMLGVKDPLDPDQNLNAGFAYLSNLIQKYGPQGGVAAYNMGPNAFEQYKVGIRKMPEETANYVQKVTGGPLGYQQTTPKMSGMERFLVGTGSGFMQAYRGIQQLAAVMGHKMGLVSPETVQDITQQGTDEMQLIEPLTRGTQVGRGAYKSEPMDWTGLQGSTDVGTEPSNIFNMGRLLGETLPYAPLGGGVAGGAARRAITAGLGGGLMGAGQFVPEGQGDRTTNTLLGLALGSASSLGMSAAGRVWNALMGNVPTSLTQQLSEKWGIPTTLSEQTTGLASRGDVLLERAPGFLGTQSFRAEQRGAAFDAVKSFMGRYIADPTAFDAREANRAFSSGMFENLKSLLPDLAEQQIAPSETRAIGRALLDRYPDIFKTLQDTRTERLIRSIVEDTTPTTQFVASTPSTLFPVRTTVPKTLTFEEAWNLRSGLGDLIGQARKQEASGQLNREAYGQFKRLFGAVSNDIDRWTTSIGREDISQAFQAANQSYKDYVVKFDILQRAYDKSVREVGDGAMFSPAKFSNNLNSILQKDNFTKVFAAGEREEMSGLANILQVVKRSGQYLENPPTGQRYGALGAMAGLEGVGFAAAGRSGMINATIGAAMTSLGAKFLTTTPTGKALALAASKVQPTSLAMQRIMNEVYNQLPKVVTQSVFSEGENQ